MLTTALVPLDGSPEAAQAMPYAQAIVPAGSQVVLLHVVPDSDLLHPELIEMLQPVPGESSVRQVAQGILDKAIADAGDTRLDWHTEVDYGEPATEILKAVTRHQAAIIVMTTQGRGGLGRAVFGSVADRIARTAPVPVLLVRPRPPGTALTPPTFKRLVVPLDGSPLAEGALPIATELATRHQTPVSLMRAINVASLLAPVTSMHIPSFAPQVYDQIIDTAQREAEQYLTAVAARLTASGAKASWVVLEGSPFVSIVEAALADDLIIMTSQGRGGAVRWFLGSVAEKLIREAPCPTLLVPAPGRSQDVDTGAPN